MSAKICVGGSASLATLHGGYETRARGTLYSAGPSGGRAGRVKALQR